MNSRHCRPAIPFFQQASPIMLANYTTGLTNGQVCSSQQTLKIEYLYPRLCLLRLLQLLPAAQTAPSHFPANAGTTVHSASNEYTNSNRITTLTKPLSHPSPTNIIHTLLAMIQRELMPSPKQLWRRAAAAVKDKQTLCLTRVLASRSRSGQRNPDMEAAIIRATSHDELTLDYTNARRVFTWARTHPVMWALSRRASRTRSWAVALKSLLLTHGLLISCDSGPLGRLPFDLSDFRDRSSSSKGYSAFVQAYFNFLDHRSILLGDGNDDDCGLERVESLQTLLELLMQIRPYADGMNVGLILEAMDCVVIEIFGVYSCICRGIAAFLVSYTEEGKRVEMRRKGLLGIKILKRAVSQSEQLSSYFEMCKGMGVGNAVGLPPVERVPEEDIRDLERLVMTENVTMEMEGMQPSTVVIVTENWVVFDGETREAASNDKGCLRTPLMATTESKSLTPVVQVGNLIEL